MVTFLEAVFADWSLAVGIVSNKTIQEKYTLPMNQAFVVPTFTKGLTIFSKPKRLLIMSTESFI